MKPLITFTLFTILIFSCYSAPINKNNNRVYSSITEYLQTIPGIQITGNDNNGNIRLTGMGTTTTQASDTTPLFVIDGQQVGRSLSGVANILNPNDIKRVKVLRSADDTSFYGINGANGVIEITTKK